MSFDGFLGLQKCSSEVDDPPEARTWASKKYVFEVDDPPEARARASKKYMFEVDTSHGPADTLHEHGPAWICFKMGPLEMHENQSESGLGT